MVICKISNDKKHKVTGIDVNRIELMQAVTTFEKINNLHFIYGNISDCELNSHSFNVIVFAASLQYFSSLNAIITKALSLLTADGEIHIIDTPFYNRNEIIHAAKRTKDYYASIGFEEMSKYYFHHHISDLYRFNYKIIYNPNSIFNKLKKATQPFYYITIKQKQ